MSFGRMRLLPAATNGRCGITGGGARIALAVAAVLRPRAFDQQAFCGFIDAEAPRNRRHAPHEIRAAAVGTIAGAVKGCAVEGLGIARPSVRFGESRGGRQRREFIRRRDQAEVFELGASRPVARLDRVNFHARKIRRVLVLEIQAAGDAGGTARVEIRLGSPTHAARKFLVGIFGEREPRLKAAGRGFEREKLGGGNARQFLGGEVVTEFSQSSFAGFGISPPRDCSVFRSERGRRGSPALLVQLTLNRPAPTLANASSIVRAALLCVPSSAMGRPGFLGTDVATFA